MRAFRLQRHPLTSPACPAHLSAESLPQHGRASTILPIRPGCWAAQLPATAAADTSTARWGHWTGQQERPVVSGSSGFASVPPPHHRVTETIPPQGVVPARTAAADRSRLRDSLHRICTAKAGFPEASDTEEFQRRDPLATERDHSVEP